MHRKKLTKRIRLPKIQDLILVASERVIGEMKTSEWTRNWRRLAGRLYGAVVYGLVKSNKYEKNMKIFHWKDFLNFSSWLRAFFSGSLKYPNQKHIISFQVKQISPEETERYNAQKESIERVKNQFRIIKEVWDRVFVVDLENSAGNESDWSVDCNHVIFISFSLRDPDTIPPSSSAPPPPPPVLR